MQSVSNKIQKLEISPIKISKITKGYRELSSVKSQTKGPNLTRQVSDKTQKLDNCIEISLKKIPKITKSSREVSSVKIQTKDPNLTRNVSNKAQRSNNCI